jgi:hypothetical protein
MIIKTAIAARIASTVMAQSSGYDFATKLNNTGTSWRCRLGARAGAQPALHAGRMNGGTPSDTG